MMPAYAYALKFNYVDTKNNTSLLCMCEFDVMGFLRYLKSVPPCCWYNYS